MSAEPYQEPTGVSLVRPEGQALERHEPSINEIAMSIAQRGDLAAVEAVERLFRLQVEKDAIEAKRLYMAAMARLQARLPQMDKDGQAKNSKFAKLENIDAVIRRPMAEEGFSVSFDEESHTEKTVTFVMVMAHEGGHSESKRLTVPVDVASKNREGVSIRPAIQDAGSTVSYARRYLIKMHLNIIEKDEDTNGEKTAKITGDEALDLNTKIKDTESNLALFLKHFRIEKLADLPKSRHGEALQMLAAKAGSKAGK